MISDSCDNYEQNNKVNDDTVKKIIIKTQN